MEPVTVYSGAVKVELDFTGRSDSAGRGEWAGRIILPSGEEWAFSDLYTHGSELESAESALSFASYYTTSNRGDDVPEWAPPAEFADALEYAADFAPDGFDHETRDAYRERGIYIGDSFVVCEDARKLQAFNRLMNFRFIAEEREREAARSA